MKGTMMGTGTGMQPGDLGLLRTLRDPRLQPGGDLVAYVVASLDPGSDARRSVLHLFDLATGEDRQLTDGATDTTPRWSPDGSRLAFLHAAEAGTEQQLALISPAGGPPDVRTSLPAGVRELAWVDDECLVVVGTQWRSPWGDLEPSERDDQPRRITELRYRDDEEGWLHDRISRLWRLDLSGRGEPEPLTPADHSVSDITVTGGTVLFHAPRQATRETDAGTLLCRVSVEGGPIEELAGPGSWDPGAATTDGGAVLCGLTDAYAWPRPPRLLHVTADGRITDLAADLDRDVVAEHGPVVLDDGTVLVSVEDRGAVHLVAVEADGARTRLVGGHQTVTGWTADPSGERVVYVSTHPTDPGELWILEDGEPRVLTAHNEELRERLLPVEHFTFERDGAEIDAWAVLPADGAGERVPLLVNIHGGPTAQYGHAFFDEFQVEAGAGYAVVACNPRGSSGRGGAWATAVVGTWMDEGSVDVLDLEALADAAIERFDRIDPDRLGIMGGSYGGYATARILSRTDRYRAAIVERGLLMWPSFGGTSDIGPWFDRMFLQRSLPADVEDQWAASPLRTAHRISTPTLVIHSEQDYRCPQEQAFQFFSMLRRHGVEAELLLFPGEGHELSRSGSPRHRVQRFEAVLDWHDRHLR